MNRKVKVVTTSRTTAKVILGWEVVYEFEVWIMPHHAGAKLILGTNFMTPAGIRLDVFKATAKMPDEIAMPLLRSAREINDTSFGDEVFGGPASSLDVESRLYGKFRLQRNQPSMSTHELWIRRLPTLLPTVIYNRRGVVTRVRLTNVSTKSASCPAPYPIGIWLPHEILPLDGGYIRLNATKYHEWQVLAYENVMDGWLFKIEQQKYAEWLSQQLPAVKRRTYTRPTGILRRDDHIRHVKTTTSDEEVDITIKRNNKESTQTEIGRAHDPRNSTGLTKETTA